MNGHPLSDGLTAAETARDCFLKAAHQNATNIRELILLRQQNERLLTRIEELTAENNKLRALAYQNSTTP